MDATPVLNVARALRFMREVNGANRSEIIDEMIRLTGLDPTKRLPWCAAFVAWVGYAVYGKLWPLKKVAGCMSLYDDAKDKGLLVTTPAPGDIFLLWGKAGDGVSRFRHTGFVVRQLPGGDWETIEGNTNEAGHPEGVGVFVRQRRWNPEDRFIRWTKAGVTTTSWFPLSWLWFTGGYRGIGLAG